jgi:hypothetical protein
MDHLNKLQIRRKTLQQTLKRLDDDYNYGIANDRNKIVPLFDKPMRDDNQLTIRDHFAMAALQSLMLMKGIDGKRWVENAYGIADAMLVERKPKEDPVIKRGRGRPRKVQS